MKVTFHATEEAFKITVLGMLERREEEEELLRLLQVEGGPVKELYLYEARTLSLRVTEALVRLTDGPEERLKIRVYHHYLSHYLSKLSIPHVLVFPRPQPEENRIDAVVLGGSADSLDKILYVVERLPAAEAPVFAVQHVQEGKENILDRLLQQRTDYRVIMPQHMAPVEKKTIYVAPPGRNMRVSNGYVYLTQDARVSYARPSIDALFESLAQEYGRGLTAVLLCGYGEDGVRALKKVRELEGTAIVEESSECQARVLTDMAIQSGELDYRFHKEEIAAYLAAGLLQDEGEPGEALISRFLEAVFVRYGYDFRGYQRSTVHRRLARLISERPGGFFPLLRDTLTDNEAFERFFLELSINVTEFFRNPELFAVLREKVLPYLDSFSHIKVWSAGCASGEEAYSLAILLDEAGMLEKSQIYATDINPYVLEEAKNGLYALENLEKSEANHRDSGGNGRLASCFRLEKRYARIKEKYREKMLFHRHSLSGDGVFNEFQLILCRNVLIYFSSELQQKVMELFARSLHRDGFLVLGRDESIRLAGGELWFAQADDKQKIYRFLEDGHRV